MKNFARLKVPIVSLTTFLVFLSQVITGCRTRSFGSLQTATSSSGGAALREMRAATTVLPLYDALTSEGVVSPPVAKAISENFRIVDSDQNRRDLDPDVKSTRPYVVSLAKEYQDFNSQSMLRAQLRAELRRQSDVVKRLWQQRDLEDAKKWDTIVVGAGPQSVAYVQEMTSKDPNSSVLVIEAQPLPGGTFSDIVDVWFLNSTNNANDGSTPLPNQTQSGGRAGQGDLNTVMDLLGIPDLSRLRWPPAGLVGLISEVGMNVSGAVAAFETEVNGVKKVDINGVDRREVEVTYRDPDTGEEKKSLLTARNVILSAGLGNKPKLPFDTSDDDTKELVEELLLEEEGKLLGTSRELSAGRESEAEAPVVQTFSAFARLVSTSDKPFRPFVDKNVLVIGGGDSGRVVVEYLTGIGPARGYGKSVSQDGRVSSVVWAGVSFTQCEEYIQRTRGRYSSLSSVLNTGLVIPTPVNVERLKIDGPRNRATVTGYRVRPPVDEKDRSPAELAIRNEEVDRVQRDLANLGLITDGTLPYRPRVAKEFKDFERLKMKFDYVIVATGFESRIPEILGIGDRQKFADGEGFEPVQAEVPDLGKVKIANEYTPLRGSGGSLYLVGPANEDIKKKPLIDQDETARVKANTVSLFANVSRTKALARKLVRPNSGGRKSIANAVRVARERLEGTDESAKNKWMRFALDRLEYLPGDQKIVLVAAATQDPNNDESDQLVLGDQPGRKKRYLEHFVLDHPELAASLQRGFVSLELGASLPRLTLNFFQKKGEGESVIRVATVPRLDENSRAALEAALESDPDLLSQIHMAFGRYKIKVGSGDALAIRIKNLGPKETDEGYVFAPFPAEAVLTPGSVELDSLGTYVENQNSLPADSALRQGAGNGGDGKTVIQKKEVLKVLDEIEASQELARCRLTDSGKFYLDVLGDEAKSIVLLKATKSTPSDISIFVQVLDEKGRFLNGLFSNNITLGGKTLSLERTQLVSESGSPDVISLQFADKDVMKFPSGGPGGRFAGFYLRRGGSLSILKDTKGTGSFNVADSCTFDPQLRALIKG